MSTIVRRSPGYVAIFTCLTTLITGAHVESAIASRPANRSERASITKAVDARPCEVGQVRISTVSRHWAIFVYGYAHGEDPVSCPSVPTGAQFLRRSQGRWKLKASGSDFDCAQQGLPSMRVQRDLGHACHSPRSVVVQRARSSKACRSPLLYPPQAADTRSSSRSCR
jgi:hypothetical protein